MNKKQDLFMKYELPLFLLLTYILSWWSAPLRNGQIIPYGPAIAALIVLGMTAGRQGLGEWWRRVTNWHIPFVWLSAGPAIILGYHAVGFVMSLLLGSQVASLPHISSGTFLELLLLGGLWEEPGWSGYLLPKMRERFASHPNGLLLAALVTGVFRAIWHLPLFLYGHMPWFDIFIFSFAFQLLIAWVFYRSGGSVLAVMLLHFVSNLMGAFTYPMFTDMAHTTYTALFMGTACLVALIIVSSGRFSPERAKGPIWQAGIR
jgi:hypothetical protein